MYSQLLVLRDNFAKSLVAACQAADSNQSVGGGVSNEDEETKKLKEQNKKLNYRVLHLTRAYEKQEEEIERLRAENAKLKENK